MASANVYRPCPRHITCAPVTRLVGQGVVEDPDSPYMNFSSEAPDPINYLGTFYFDDFPPPDTPYQWAQMNGGMTGGYFSGVSQQDANDRARTNVQDAGWNNREQPPGLPWNSGPTTGSPEIFENAAVTCGQPCPAGGTTEYTVEAGTVHALSQEEADAIAASLCEERAGIDPLCIGTEELPGSCVGEEYSQQITASGGNPFQDQVPPYSYLFGVSDGMLPSGLEIDPYDGTIYGTPTTAGSYTFTVSVLDASFNIATEDYTVFISEITSGTLESGIVGTAYSQQLVGTVPAGCTGVWAVTSGSLPPGLELDPNTGIISDTGVGPGPTLKGDYSFQVSLTIECP